MSSVPSPRVRPLRTARLVAAHAILLAAIAACGDGGTGPRPRIDVPDATLLAATDAVDDAGDRIAMQLDQATGGGTLYARLNELASRMATRDPVSVADALARSRAALDAADGSGPAAEAPDRAAIRVALDAVQTLLELD